MRVINISDDVVRGRSAGARECAADMCLNKTREGKPYCSDHVERNPYASQIMKALARRDAEDQAMRGPNFRLHQVSVNAITAQEIIHHLSEFGTRTRKRLCRELNLEPKVLDRYADMLLREGIVRPGTTRRRDKTLTLIENPSPRSSPYTRSSPSEPLSSSLE